MGFAEHQSDWAVSSALINRPNHMASFSSSFHERQAVIGAIQSR